MNIKNVLLIDISTRNVQLPESYIGILEQRLLLQSAVVEERIKKKVQRQGFSYSRGLLTLAACLERNGFNVYYIVYLDSEDRKKLPQLIKESDAVCISAVTLTIDLAANVSKFAKKINSRILSIIGGIHATSLPLETMKSYPGFDILLTGECENRIVSILKDISHPDIVGGAYYRVGEDVVESSAQVEKVILSELPSPAYHLLSRPLHQYSHNIRTARGCPYKCNFCAERHSWNSSLESEHTVKQIIDEIDFLSARLPKNTLLHFSDAVFNLKPDRTLALAREISKITSGLLFSIDTRVDLIDEKEVAILKDANFTFFRLGFENTNSHILNMSFKSITEQQQNLASEIVRKTAPDAAIFAYWITGLPGTTQETIFADINVVNKLITSNTVDVIGNKVFVPYPETAQFNNPEFFGMEIYTYNWKKYVRASIPVFHLAELSADKIYLGFIEQEKALLDGYQIRLGDSWSNRVSASQYQDHIKFYYLRKQLKNVLH